VIDLNLKGEIKLAHLNVRTEKHGADDVTAIDLKLVYTCGAATLEQLHRELPDMLFDVDPKETALDGVDAAATVLAFPALQPMRYSGEQSGLVLRIDHGLGGGSDLVLGDCTADHFVIDAHEGGSVDLTLRVRCTCVDERVLGRLPLLLGRTLPMHLHASDSVEQAKAASPAKGKLAAVGAQT
jgi:hypothetical protein